jgi:hypothetical protein
LHATPSNKASKKLASLNVTCSKETLPNVATLKSARPEKIEWRIFNSKNFAPVKLAERKIAFPKSARS